MNEEKIDFLKNRFTALLKEIPADTLPLFGKMNLQQMVEHFTDSIRIASGKNAVTEIITPEENIPKMQAFLMSDKPFRENTPNPLMPESPAPVQHKTIEEAIDELQQEIDFFFEVFEENEQEQTLNSFFGKLNFEMNVQLLHKHALHHLRQFGR